MKDTGTGRIIYIDILRIIATFSVMMLHVSAQNWYRDVHTSEWMAFNVYDSISRWGVPIFTMISGSLFLNRELSLKQIYSKYIFRIVVAFITWSIFYAFVYNIIGEPDIKAFVKSAIEGHYHMWYLFMIVGLYMIIPFMKLIADNKRYTEYFLLLSLVFAFILPQMKAIVSVYLPSYGAFLGALINKPNFHFTLGFSSYFLLGYYLDKQKIGKKIECLIVFMGLIGAVVTVVFTKSVSIYTNKGNGIFYGNLTINVLVEALLVFVVCKNRLSAIKLKPRTEMIIRKLSKYSFGAYLIHPMVISVLNKLLHLNTLSFNPYLSVPVISILVFFISFGTSAIVNQIPVLNRYIV